MFLYSNVNSVNKGMRKGKIYRSTEKNNYFSFWRLSAGFSLRRNKSMFIFYLYIFLSEILRNSKAEWNKRKKHVSDRGIHKLDSWDRRQNPRFTTWGTGRSSTGPERKVLTAEQSSEVNGPELCVTRLSLFCPWTGMSFCS